MKALLIDHDDSFTLNLKHWLKPLFQEIHVINHLHLFEIKNFASLENQFDLFVLSPGPKAPKDYPHTLKMLEALKSTTHVYGVCLGLQMMAASCGYEVETYSPPKHGKTSKLKIKNKKLKEFENLKVARYHSIRVSDRIRKNFELLAESEEDHIPMWLEHKNKKWLAVQFHPESFLTEKAELHRDALKKWMHA